MNTNVTNPEDNTNRHCPQQCYLTAEQVLGYRKRAYFELIQVLIQGNGTVEPMKDLVRVLYSFVSDELYLSDDIEDNRVVYGVKSLVDFFNELDDIGTITSTVSEKAYYWDEKRHLTEIEIELQVDAYRRSLREKYIKIN